MQLVSLTITPTSNGYTLTGSFDNGSLINSVAESIDELKGFINNLADHGWLPTDAPVQADTAPTDSNVLDTSTVDQEATADDTDVTTDTVTNTSTDETTTTDQSSPTNE